jgi:type II secretory pathway component PulC
MKQPMARYASWLANAALVASCCFLVAQTANAIFAALLVSEPAPLVSSEAPASPRPRSWSERQIILSRNLFQASVLPAAEPTPPPQEELEATELPLGLLGTAASPSPELAVAVIWDAESGEHVVVEVGDALRNGQANVLRIERRRVVLSENGALRELVMDEDSEYRPPRRPSRRARRSAPDARARSRRARR